MKSLAAYRNSRKWTQSDLAQALGVSQAYVSQVEAGARPISRKLAARLARLPDLPAAIVPPGHADLDAADADFADELMALGYPGFASRSREGRLPGTQSPETRAPESRAHEAPQSREHEARAHESQEHETRAREIRAHETRAREARRPAPPTRLPRNPAALIVAILSRRQVAPSVMAAIPWVLVTHADLEVPWLVDQARRRNLQNRLGFLTDLALDVARARAARMISDDARSRSNGGDTGDRERPDVVSRLEDLRADLETSRLANVDTLARELTPAERQFFEEHRGAAARHWNLLTGLTVVQLPYK